MGRYAFYLAFSKLFQPLQVILRINNSCKRFQTIVASGEC
jgi:hypothetical protein